MIILWRSRPNTTTDGEHCVASSGISWRFWICLVTVNIEFLIGMTTSTPAIRYQSLIISLSLSVILNLGAVLLHHLHQHHHCQPLLWVLLPTIANDEYQPKLFLFPCIEHLHSAHSSSICPPEPQQLVLRRSDRCGFRQRLLHSNFIGQRDVWASSERWMAKEGFQELHDPKSRNKPWNSTLVMFSWAEDHKLLDLLHTQGFNGCHDIAMSGLCK